VSAFRPFLVRALSGVALSGDEMREAAALLFDGAASEIEIAGFLSALAARGETPDEIAAAAAEFRARAVCVEGPDDLVDTCGVGGDGLSTLNISTAAAIVAAGAGARIAKHGNRAVSSRSGSADVLEALGLKLELTDAQRRASWGEAGCAFLFAPGHHPAAARLGPVRRALGARTLFNLLGPLANPAGARRQLLGVPNERLMSKMASALMTLGVERAFVVHGADGLDELSISGPSALIEIRAGSSRALTITPTDAGLPVHPIEAVRGGPPEENARAIEALLNGARGAFRDIVALNAGAALTLADRALSIRDGARLAEAAIDDGRAKETLRRLIAISRGN
jgi:anthranilate phosphoribosyltransferase